MIYHYVIKQSAKKYGAEQDFYTVELVRTEKHQLLFYFVYDIIFSFLTNTRCSKVNSVCVKACSQ